MKEEVKSVKKEIKEENDFKLVQLQKIVKEENEKVKQELNQSI
tara:strand:+ start:123 stop:251 length:129 start_codon:yes stop_codon:yes gene_type:complete